MLSRHRDDEISRSKLMFVKLACDVFARIAAKPLGHSPRWWIHRIAHKSASPGAFDDRWLSGEA